MKLLREHARGMSKEVVDLSTLLEKVSRRRARAPEGIPARLTREQMVQRIIDANGCGKVKATGFVDSITRGVQGALDRGESTWWPSEEWLDRYHSILVTVAPDRAVSKPGTPHADLEGYILDPTKGQLALTHDMGTVERVEHCCVTLKVQSFG